MGGWVVGGYGKARRETTASWLLQKKAVCKDKGCRGRGRGGFYFPPPPPALRPQLICNRGGPNNAVQAVWKVCGRVLFKAICMLLIISMLMSVGTDNTAVHWKLKAGNGSKSF